MKLIQRDFLKILLRGKKNKYERTYLECQILQGERCLYTCFLSLFSNNPSAQEEVSSSTEKRQREKGQDFPFL